MVMMLVGTSDPPCQDREGAQDTEERENKETLSAEKRQSAAAVKEQCACLLYLWRHLSARVRKTERSLKFVVCGDEPAVN